MCSALVRLFSSSLLVRLVFRPGHVAVVVILDPDNVHVGVACLRRLTDEFGTELALAAYNAGAVRRYNGIPPYDRDARLGFTNAAVDTVRLVLPVLAAMQASALGAHRGIARRPFSRNGRRVRTPSGSGQCALAGASPTAAGHGMDPPPSGHATCAPARRARPATAGSGVSGRSRPRSSARRPTDRCPAQVGDGLQSRSRAGFPPSSPQHARATVRSGAHRRSAGCGHRPPRLCRAASANRPQPAQVVSQSVIESRSKLGTEWGAEIRRIL